MPFPGYVYSHSIISLYNWIILGDKIFQGGPNIIETYGPGVQILWGSKYSATDLTKIVGPEIFWAVNDSRPPDPCSTGLIISNR